MVRTRLHLSSHFSLKNPHHCERTNTYKENIYIIAFSSRKIENRKIFKEPLDNLTDHTYKYKSYPRSMRHATKKTNTKKKHT